MEAKLKPILLPGGGTLVFNERWKIYEKTKCNAQCRERDRKEVGKQLIVAGPPEALREAEAMAMEVIKADRPDCLVFKEKPQKKERYKSGTQNWNNEGSQWNYNPWTMGYQTQGLQVATSGEARKLDFQKTSNTYVNYIN